jgi:hypothetical protein
VRAALVLMVLALAACEAKQPSTAAPVAEKLATSGKPPHDLLSCGGNLRSGAVAAYFERLQAALDSGGPVPISFYDAHVGIMSGGQYLTFKREDFKPGAGALLSNAEWKEILDRGYEDMQSIGWRGCMLADGKAGFQSDPNGDIVLSSFDKDRAWVASRRNM